MFIFYAISCTVIEAPEDFDSLTTYLFQNLETEEEKILEAGVNNMIDWLDQYGHDLDEGYQVDDLSLPAIHSADPTVEEVSLMGAAVSMDIRHSINDVAYLLFIEGHNDDPPDPEAVSYNIRTYQDDPECFVEQECGLLNYSGVIAIQMPLNILVNTTIDGQVRWVESKAGPALVQRRWFSSLPDVSVDWLDLRAEYALKLSLPFSDTSIGSRRIEMTWIDVTIGDIPVGEEIGLMLGINAIKDNITSLNEQNMPVQ